MKSIFLKKMWNFLILAMVLTICSIFIMMTFIEQNNMKNEANIVLENVKEEIETNDNELNTIKDELNKEYLEKTRMLAYMIQKNPEIAENYDDLADIQVKLGCDEIDIFNEKGIIVSGTEKDYYGFDAASGDQSRPFLQGLTDKSFELAQEPQPNVADGKLFQYIGVARQDKSGIVQIGIIPEKLQKKLENNKISNTLKKFSIRKDGSILVINKSNNAIEYFKDTNYIGKKANEIGIPEDFIKSYKAKQFIKINGRSEMCIPIEYKDYLLCAIIPKGEVYQNRVSQLLMVLICITIIFVGLSLLITRILNNDVIEGIDKIIEKLNMIRDGNLNVKVDVVCNKEFESLSNGINDMVNSINVSADQIVRYSDEVLDIAKGIRAGADEQNDAVNELSVNIEHIYENIKTSCALSNNAKEMAKSVVEDISIGNEKIKEVTEAMNLINNASGKINEIIKDIESLADKSNMLALNASIEASKAGDQGSSFVVIAKEMAALAGTSKQSAASTNVLIQNTINAINEGNAIVNETVETLGNVMKKVDDVAEIVTKAAEETKKQENFVEVIQNKMHTISEVVEENATNAANSEMTSEKLTEQVKKLQMVK